jgi:hypothetical protein
MATLTEPTPASPGAFRPLSAVTSGWHPRGGILPLALVIVLAQVFVACLLSGQTDLGAAYRSLFRWDGGWYRGIAESGYHTPAHLTRRSFGNVAFFPAYPCLGGLVARLFGLETPVALLLTAQVCAWGFWTYLILLGRQLLPRPRLLGWAMLLVALHPASFFLVAGYTESLFLFGLLGFLYWGDRPGPAAFVLAAVHGYVMTATRLVGVPLVVYPLLQAWLHPTEERPLPGARLRRLVRAAVLGAVASLGAASFFAYCQLHFGQWDLYMKTEAVGWSVRPDYLALFSWRTYRIGWPQWRDYYVDPEFLGRLSVPVLLAAFVTLLAVELRRGRRSVAGLRERLPLYCGAWLLFYVPVCGHASRCLSSVLRFELCAYPLLVLAVLHLVARAYPGRPPRRTRRLLAGWLLLSLVFNLAMTWRFTHGLWVA